MIHAGTMSTGSGPQSGSRPSAWTSNSPKAGSLTSALPAIPGLNAASAMKAVLTGTIITETIFAWPGVGRLLIQAITFRDYPLVQGCILLIAVTYVAVNLLVDVLYGWLDPRIRYE